jgi:HlyD family secretion protein
LRAAEAEFARLQWNLDQKRQLATADALVFDTMYREGEWVEAGHAIVALLPPPNVKVRTFVPETRVGAIRVGAAARVHVDGVEQPALGSVTFVSPRAEFTPPVIFSRESRSKFVFLVEIRFAPEIAATLHPGQPVDVRIEVGP